MNKNNEIMRSSNDKQKEILILAGIETLKDVKLTHESYWSMSGRVSNIAESVALIKAKNTALTIKRNAKINTYADVNENANMGLSIDMSNGIPLDIAGSMSSSCLPEAFKNYRNAQIKRLLEDEDTCNAVKELTL